jgi:hypothetical protein
MEPVSVRCSCRDCTGSGGESRPEETDLGRIAFLWLNGDRGFFLARTKVRPCAENGCRCAPPESEALEERREASDINELSPKDGVVWSPSFNGAFNG